jgi:signal transduction histidine kinase/GAF domain-containing protein
MGPDQGTLRAQDTVHQLTPEGLRIFHDMAQGIGTLLDHGALMSALVARVAELGISQRVLLLVSAEDEPVLKFGAATEGELALTALEALNLLTYPPDTSPLVQAWMDGLTIVYPCADDALNTAAQPLAEALSTAALAAAPLLRQGRLLGVLVAAAPAGVPTLELRCCLESAAAAAVIALENARAYNKTVQNTAASMHELFILRQIDRELNDTIEPEHVFGMTLDWALRFTNASAAAVALYDQDSDMLHEMLQYGYDIHTASAETGGSYSSTPYRVARAGHPEIIPDVSMDKDFVRRASSTRSQMCVPVLREDRVIAVITVESKRLNGFTDEHLDFVEKLATRAGVAIDNARLFSETKREREKLSNVINTTADVVIVCGTDDRIILINPAAFTALRLDSSQDYIGMPFESVFANTPLMDAYRHRRASSSPSSDEVLLPDSRTFQFNLTPQVNVGWIIVMHDITPFKEMDRLKSELIATVSHDLKQPLSVMNGYTELLLMHRKLDDTGISFIDMVRKSIQNMRQLIDDLLDLAKIESGIRLELEPVALNDILYECVKALQPTVSSKNMTVTVETSDTLPDVMADRIRLQQVFSNLIGNAVKYTPPEGWVRVAANNQNSSIRVVIQDNGLGISPEDQAHVFERFYRVRRPETDSIEGTGLGLAIVRSLVEAHNGQITLESKLGQGSSFTLSLPVYQPIAEG